MKTCKIKIAATLVLLMTMNASFAQKDRDRRDNNDRNYQDRNNGRNGGNRNNYNRDDRNERNDQNRNDYDRDDNDRIRDYERGRNDYRKNPYDYRNLPRDWDRQTTRQFDWYRFDWDNRYDPRYGNRDYYDLYFPWDPNNPYDIRNRRDFYGNNQYWNGGRTNRVIIVPPIIRRGHPAWGYRNHPKHNRGHGRRW